MNKKINNLSKLMIIVLALSLALTGCNGSRESGKVENNEESNIDNNNSDKKVDEETGLVFERSMELKYAKSFSVDYYKDGYKKLTDSAGRKVLLVPEGKDVPEVVEGVQVIKQPIEEIGVLSTGDMALVTALNGIDRVTMVATAMEDWYIPQVVEKMESGDIKFIGKSDSLDYELIEANKPDLMFVSLGREQTAQKLTNRFDELDIDWIGIRVSKEEDPRGRLEWIKYIGAILDKEEEAEAFFEGELAKIQKVEDEIKSLETEKPKVAYVRITKDGYTVKNKGDYSVKMLELAGGEYIFEDLNPDKDGTMKISAEEFYTLAEDVDILIYENMGPFVGSISQILEKGEHLKDIKAIKEGRVWGTKKNYWQSVDKTADMIVELYEIFTKPQGEIKDTEHYFLMD